MLGLPAIHIRSLFAFQGEGPASWRAQRPIPGRSAGKQVRQRRPTRLLAVAFATLFAFIGLSIPDAFKGIAFEDDSALASSLFYLSFVTLTSTGYGDVVPMHPLARSLCNIESIVGQLYPATILARLVTLELEMKSS